MSLNGDLWAQWTTPGRVTLEGREASRCQMAAGPPAAGEQAQMVRIDAAGFYACLRFKGGIMISKEEFAMPEVWQDYVSNKFYACCAQNRY
jgi:hypothetical protein